METSITTACTVCAEPYRLRPVLRGYVVRCRVCGCGFEVETTGSRRMADFLARAPKSPAKRERGKVWPRRGISSRPRLQESHTTASLSPAFLFGVGSVTLMALASLATFLAVETFIAP